MLISDYDLKNIGDSLLTNGNTFSPNQVKVIKARGSIDIVAGPGSGKTTVLIAKCASLLKNSIDKNQGLCLITHTNVAVEEIKSGLQKTGLGEVEYPNFLGTIQDFMNTFITKKAFHLLLGRQKFKVLDDEEYQLKFEEVFDEEKPDWYSYPPPKFKYKNPSIVIQNNLSWNITSDAPDGYIEVFNGCIKNLLEQGYITNKQCLELSNWYINLYKTKLSEAFAKRFKYVFLDEAQDTSEVQFALLHKIFDNENVTFQKFGDPYQALYNIFEDNIDVWNPTYGTNYEEMSETTRFGSKLSDVVKNICVEKYDTLKSLDIVDSFAPHYIIYEDKSDLMSQYSRLIEFYEGSSITFSNSNKKDALLAPHHTDLKKIFKSYEKQKIKNELNENIIGRTYHYFVALFAKELDTSFRETLELFSHNEGFKQKIGRCIKSFLHLEGELNQIKNDFNSILKEITCHKKTTFTSLSLENELFSYKSSLNESPQLEDREMEERNFYVGTVHSAKGETHRSTLLVLNTKFSRGEEEYWMLELLREYLYGNHINPNTIRNEIRRNETIKSLKLAYVALSRPTHLAIIAIPQDLATNIDFCKLEDNSWINPDDLP